MGGYPASEDKAEEMYQDIDRQEYDLFKSLSEQEQAAINEEWEHDNRKEDLGFIVNDIWSTELGSQFLGVGIDEQNAIIEYGRRKYVYPDFAQLVGPPNEDHIDADINRLTVERQSELLLLGVFEWNGLYVARSYNGEGWFVCKDPDYEPVDVLGLGYLDEDGRYTQVQTERHAYQVFMPFYGVKKQWLHDYLIECDIELGTRPPRKKYQVVQFKDGNPYNCLPDNLELAGSRGRKMICQACGRQTTADESIVISRQGQKDRVCSGCLRKAIS